LKKQQKRGTNACVNHVTTLRAIHGQGSELAWSAGSQTCLVWAASLLGLLQEIWKWGWLDRLNWISALDYPGEPGEVADQSN
jgi:hypothetical protein